MSNFSHHSLQKAIYQTLTDDITLMAMITGVFDYVPQDIVHPYITLGNAEIADWSSKTTNGTAQIVALYVFSRSAGRKQAADIMERIYTLLHQVGIAVSGQTLVMMRFINSEITQEADGLSYKGAMKFRALLQSN